MAIYLGRTQLDMVLDFAQEWSDANHSAGITVRDRYAGDSLRNEDRCIGFVVSQNVDTNSAVSALCISLFRVLTWGGFKDYDGIQMLLTGVHVDAAYPYTVVYFPSLKMLDA